MIPFRKAVTLRGALGRDAEAPTSEAISDEPCIVLALLIEFISSDKPTGLRMARTLQVPVVCSGPDFCGADQDMKERDLIEVEGELRLCEEDGPVVWSPDPRVMRVSSIKVRASHVHKIGPPAPQYGNPASRTHLSWFAERLAPLRFCSHHAASSSRRKGHP
jgi:hypothetical protein